MCVFEILYRIKVNFIFNSGITCCFASGYRNPRSGVLGAIGSHSWLWASENLDAIACNLYFLDSTVRSQNTLDRAHGFVVRCVQNLRFELTVTL